MTAHFQKHTLHLFEGGYSTLGELSSPTKPAEIIRKLVRAYINKIESDLEDETIIAFDDTTL